MPVPMSRYHQWMAAAAAVRKRVRADLTRLVQRRLGVQEFSRAATRTLERAVPFDGTCVLTFDPATLLPTGEFVENGLPVETMARLIDIELREPDFNKFGTLAAARSHAASLSDATAGELEQSRRQRELRRPSGFADELRAVFSDDLGTSGALTLLREMDRPHFSPSEWGFVASLAELLAEGLRRAALFGDVTTDEETATGLIVLLPDNTVEMANRAAERFLDELDAGDAAAHLLPTAVRSVAARTRRTAFEDRSAGADGPGTDLAQARVRTGAGRWVVVRGSILSNDGDDGPRVAILLEAARPAELAPLIADAYALTERERRLTELVARGFSTNEIADRLHLSAYTVQDHLKSIFDKSGTSSRGDLVARLFFDHYAPRLSGATPTTPDRPASRSST